MAVVAPPEGGVFVLDLGVIAAPEAALWVDRAGGAERVMALDRESGFAARPVGHVSLAAPLRLAPGERVEIWARLRLHTNLDLSPEIAAPGPFAARAAAETARSVAAQAALLAMAAMMLAVAAALADRAALFYGLYIGAVALWSAHVDGQAFRYLWPEAPGLNHHAARPMHAAMAILGAFFVRAFFELPRRAPWLDRVFLTIIGVSAAFALSTALTDDRRVTGLGFLWVAIGAQAYLAAGILALRRGWPGSHAFTIGAAAVSGACVVSAVAHAAPDLVTIEQTRDVGRLAFLVEAAAFIAAIAGRIAAVRREKARASAAAIAALEEKLALAEELRAADAAHREATALAERRRAEMAHATHDIRQPLAALRLALRGLPEEPRAGLERHCAYLEELVERYLEGAAEAGDPEAAPPPGAVEAVPAALLLETVAAMFEGEAAAKGIRLGTVASSLAVRADPMAAIRCLANLAANAVAHSEGARVLIGCRRQGDRLAFLVCDTGRGIAPERLAEIWRPGERGAGSEGKGLGLAVVAELAEAHGFRVEARSRPGRGSVFSLSIPRAEAPLT